MSPIDGSPMRQINRYGIEIDVCPTSGGIWLDKGELEKLMVLLREEATNDHRSSYRNEAARRSDRYDYDEDDDRYEDHASRGGKKGKMSRIMDIFDF